MMYYPVAIVTSGPYLQDHQRSNFLIQEASHIQEKLRKQGKWILNNQLQEWQMRQEALKQVERDLATHRYIPTMVPSLVPYHSVINLPVTIFPPMHYPVYMVTTGSIPAAQFYCTNLRPQLQSTPKELNGFPPLPNQYCKPTQHINSESPIGGHSPTQYDPKDNVNHPPLPKKYRTQSDNLRSQCSRQNRCNTTSSTTHQNPESQLKEFSSVPFDLKDTCDFPPLSKKKIQHKNKLTSHCARPNKHDTTSPTLHKKSKSPVKEISPVPPLSKQNRRHNDKLPYQCVSPNYCETGAIPKKKTLHKTVSPMSKQNRHQND